MVQLAAQSAPSGAVQTALYTVPASTHIQQGKIVICNRGANDTIRIAIRRGGATLANQHYIAYDLPVLGGDIFANLPEIAASSGDIIEVYSAGGTCTFTLFAESSSG